MANFDKADWPVRKIIYYVVGIVLFVSVTAGWVTEDQIETALSTGERVTAYLAAAGLVFAGTKTHRGSDDKNTEADVLNAAINSGSNDAALNQIQRQLADLSELVTLPKATPTEDTDAEDETAPGIYPTGE
ncbi:hypothetical protein KZX32_06115 [Corynebacterium kefirresidentii]|uniref:hypothetical protein n=1 Tax=Corynebacterium kefirresidentii TaxID=1979527 RepID=UPI002004C904|nr:hypothetical protein [Corynebacterium kefirresidentii]MCK6083065.1 hypothetical protein [Corynebacterium kefirresidentii]